jgi:hypothetical protein
MPSGFEVSNKVIGCCDLRKSKRIGDVGGWGWINSPLSLRSARIGDEHEFLPAQFRRRGSGARYIETEPNSGRPSEECGVENFYKDGSSPYGPTMNKMRFVKGAVFLI